MRARASALLARVVTGRKLEATGWRESASPVPAEPAIRFKAMVFSGESRTALFRLGVGEHQLEAVAAGKPVAFYLSDAAEGTTAVLLLTAEGRLRVGIYTIQNKEGRGLQDFLIFDIKARAVAKAMAAREIELMGLR